jgi:hypothetical protein
MNATTVIVQPAPAPDFSIWTFIPIIISALAFVLAIITFLDREGGIDQLDVLTA